MEEQEQDWRGLMFDKYSIVCSLLNWDLGRVMILEEQERNWRSRDEIGGAETKLGEQRRDWRSRDEIGGAETRLEEQSRN